MLTNCVSQRTISTRSFIGLRYCSRFSLFCLCLRFQYSLLSHFWCTVSTVSFHGRKGLFAFLFYLVLVRVYLVLITVIVRMYSKYSVWIAWCLVQRAEVAFVSATDVLLTSRVRLMWSWHLECIVHSVSATGMILTVIVTWSLFLKRAIGIGTGGVQSWCAWWCRAYERGRA